ncbi:hypothetical protein ACFLZL_02430 [Thermodesulfobacteriota bacterium]
MGKKFIQLVRSETTVELMSCPNEFILLCQIAYRARRTDKFNRHNLKPGEALIGDYKSIGLSEGQYRRAKDKLELWGFATFQGTNKGTIAKLINSKVFDINIETERRASRQNSDAIGDEQGDRTTTTNNNDKNDNNDKKSNGAGRAVPSYKIQCGQYFDELNKKGLTLDELSKSYQIEFNPFQFLQMLLNDGYHAGAIDEVYGSLIKAWPPRKTPQAYIAGTLTKVNGRWRERDHIEQQEDLKQINTELLRRPEFKQLVAGIG